MTRRIIPLITATLFAFTTLFSVSAGQVETFPDVMTTNLVYSSIEESHNSIISGQTLFGGISYQGDELRLQATAFSVSNTGGISFLTGNLDATITANPGSLINSITIKENGRSLVFGAGSMAFANLDTTVIAGGNNFQDQADYTKTGVAGPPDAEVWDLSVSFSFSPTNEVLLSIRNDLLVDGTLGVASIGKDNIQIIVGVTAIPEPSSAFVIAALGVAGSTIRRRRV